MNNSKNHKLILSVMLLFTSIFILNCGDKKSNDKPNVIIIMADDLGYSDLGCYGSEISTPNLDKLSESGIRFNRFYNTTRCCPTRASLLTGLYPHNAGLGKMVHSAGKEGKPGPYQGYLSRNAVTIAEVLKQNGYHNYMAGKWHVGEAEENWPLQRGFENYFGLISGASSYFEIIKDQPRIREMVLDSNRWEPPKEDFYMTDYISDYAVKWISKHNSEYESPFFLYVAYTAPHWPLHALPEDIAKYEGVYDIGWDSLRISRYNNLKILGIIDEDVELSKSPDSIPKWEDVENKEDWSRRMQVYAAMVDRMDQGIGRIIQKLKDENQLENTLIIFISDNGASSENVTKRGLNNVEIPIGLKGSYVAYREPWANASNTPFRNYKKSGYEGGVSSPFIAHWPNGIKDKGILINQRAHVIDLLPTVLDVTQTEYPNYYKGNQIKPVDGISFLSTLKTSKSFERGPLYWEHYGNRAIREGKWKLTAPKGEKWELYNLKIDGSETNNVAKEYPNEVNLLSLKYKQWAEKVGVKK